MISPGFDISASSFDRDNRPLIGAQCHHALPGCGTSADSQSRNRCRSQLLKNAGSQRFDYNLCWMGVPILCKESWPSDITRMGMRTLYTVVLLALVVVSLHASEKHALLVGIGHYAAG